MEQRDTRGRVGNADGAGAPTESSSQDPLTGLPYRAALVAGLETALNGGGPSRRDVLVIAIDLESFTEINQLLGRQRGDVILVTLADRLRRCVREEDLVARIGGDEFGAVCRGGAGLRSALPLLTARIEEAFSAPISFREGDLVVGAAVAAVGAEGGETSGELLLARAEASMRERSGGRSWFADPRAR